MSARRRVWLAAATIVLGGFSSCCCETTPSYEVRPVPPAAAVAHDGRAATRALVFGDFGETTCQQAAVADAMAEAQRADPFDLALVVGDNLYFCGPDVELPGARACAFADGNAVDPAYTPPYDARFDELHELPLGGLVGPDGAPLPTYLALGNHDVRANGGCSLPGHTADETARARACLEVAHHSAHWRMPARHYVVDTPAARFVVIDSNVVVAPYGGFTFEDELAFVRDAVSGCGARPCFLMLHHPPASSGEGGAPDPANPRWPALREAVRGKVSAWFTGHEHDLQHLRLADGADAFVAGNTCRGDKERFHAPVPDGELRYATLAWGFATLEVWPDGAWSVRFVGTDGRPLHCCESAAAAGPCVPVACSAP